MTSPASTAIWVPVSIAMTASAGAKASAPLMPSPTKATRSFVVHAGEFGAASALIEEADAIIEATGKAPVKYASLMLAAWRGDETEALDLFEAGQARGDGARRGHGARRARAGQPRCCTTVSAATPRRWRPPSEAASTTTRALRVGARRAGRGGVRSGATEAAAAALDRLEERTQAGGTDWALGVQAWSRALLSDGPRRRAPLPRGDRAARAQPDRGPPRPCAVSCTASGCVARTGASMPASSFAPPTRCSARSGPRRSPSAPAASCWRPARPPAGAPSRPAACSRPRRRRSPGSPATACPTPRSARSCSSAREPSQYHLRKVFHEARHHLPQPAAAALPSRPAPRLARCRSGHS